MAILFDFLARARRRCAKSTRNLSTYGVRRNHEKIRFRSGFFQAVSIINVFGLSLTAQSTFTTRSARDKALVCACGGFRRDRYRSCEENCVLLDL